VTLSVDSLKLIGQTHACQVNKYMFLIKSSWTQNFVSACAHSKMAHALLHPSYSHPVLQDWACEGANVLPKSALVWPLFVLQDDGAKQPIAAMPGQCRWGSGRLREALDEPVRRGLKAVILFGVMEDEAVKDAHATPADAAGAPVLRAIAVLRAAYPGLLLIVDLCLCAYTSHGHCGLMVPAEGVPGGMAIDNAASIARLAAVAVSFARAGANVIAPSDMMDGRVGAIKAGLREAGFGSRVPVMAYSSKFASCFYGPFRDAAHSGMSFGDRTLYQLPPGSRSLALRAVARDLEEGADMVMVKPGLPYLDIVADIRAMTAAPGGPRAGAGVPIAVYHVSGEYAMLVHAAAAGAFDLKRAVMEVMTCFTRAGCSIILTYFAPSILEWLDADSAGAATAAAPRA
jgi:porphobilinogen synthase